MGSVFRQPGRQTWMLKYSRRGRPIFESSGTTSYDEARKVLQRREGAIADGALAARPGHLTAAAAFADVLRDYRINGKASLPKAEAMVRLHLGPWFGGQKLAAITTADVRAYVDLRLSAVKTPKRTASMPTPVPTGPKPATINRELALLKRAFSLAIKAGLVTGKPHIPMLAERNVRTGFFEREAFDAVCAQLSAPVRAAATFGYFTGWRMPSEVLTLQWRQVDLGAGVVRLEPGTTKNREGRVFVVAPLPELVAVLEGQAAERDRLRKAGTVCPWVFHRDGVPLTDYRGEWARACQAAGVPGRLQHDLRRTAVRNLVRAGVSEKVAMLMTGHKTRSVFDRYDIVCESDLRAAAEKLAGHVTVSATVSGRRGRGGRDGTMRRKA